MATVKGCNIPEDLYYNVDNNVWARREADGTVTVGMTAYAAAIAGQIVSCTPKKVGRSIELNKSAVTVESGKWVGPVKSPVAGEVVAVNDTAVSTPATINTDPYGSGWLARCLRCRKKLSWTKGLRAGSTWHAGKESSLR